jgi:hypothetical protein
MAKRKPLVAPDQLSKELKKSTGQGLGAFFAPSPPAESEPEPEEREAPEVASEEQAEEPNGPQPQPAESKQAIQQESNITSNIANNITSNIANNITSNITILQFSTEDIDQLKEPAYKAQTFRLTEREVEWVRDVSHQLSKEFRRGKVSQADILRVAIKLFENALALNKADVMKILEVIK